MREALRRRIPKTRGWYTGTILAILAAIGLIIWLIWRSVQAQSPQRVVETAIEAARGKNVAAMGALLTGDSMSDPAAQTWLTNLTAALGREGVAITDVDILRDQANVSVGIPHRGTTGGTQVTQVTVKAARIEGQWLIDLPNTMASTNLQFWLSIAAEEQ
jgi:hypothetical protein